MDNFSLDIISNSRLLEALTIGFSHHGKATHFRVEPAGREVEAWYRGEKSTHKAKTARLVLGWHESMQDSQPLPFPLKIDDGSALNFVTAWLSDQPYGPQPDHDGDNGHGFYVYNESWGHIGHDPYAFLAIEPAWAMYGK